MCTSKSRSKSSLFILFLLSIPNLVPSLYPQPSTHPLTPNPCRLQIQIQIWPLHLLLFISFKSRLGKQGWAAQPTWADADTWFERQQQEEEMQKLQVENQAAMQAAEDLHRKKQLEEREGEKDKTDDPMARAEAEV
ncbi:hypothetical protein LINPERPRIM_LOCUS38477 [Linum perenne]